MKALLPYLAVFKLHRLRLAFGILLAVVTLLASIGLLTLSGWFLAASSLAGFYGLYSFNYMLPAAGVRGAAIIRTTARYFERLVSHDGTFRVLQHLRVTTFTRLLPLTPGGLTRFQQGDLLTRLVSDVENLDHLYLRVISPLISSACVIVVITVGLSCLDISFALLLGFILFATLILLPSLFYRWGYPSGRTLTQLRSDYRSLLMRWLSGMAELKIYGTEPDYRHQLNSLEQRWQETQRYQSVLQGCAQALLLLISGITVTLMLWLSADGVGTYPRPEALIALILFLSMAAFEALAPVSIAFQHLGQVIAAAERITQITRQEPAVTFDGAFQPETDHITLTLTDVSFSYETAMFPALQNITLHLGAGEKLALIGQTGCGKSTLLQLLTRAWDPQQGTIVLNRRPISEWRETALRKMITVVSQRVHLFSDTLRNNLLIALPQATDDQLNTALQQTGLGKLLEGEGLNCWLGEGGRQLSGGERRRLGIARALLHDGSLWLLDEPTEGLDAQTEQQILLLLKQVTRNKSVIMVTHRLQCIEEMDYIGVLDGGLLVEWGTHEELITKRGHYYFFRQWDAL